jgi:hypothetical protein
LTCKAWAALNEAGYKATIRATTGVPESATAVSSFIPSDHASSTFASQAPPLSNVMALASFRRVSPPCTVALTSINLAASALASSEAFEVLVRLRAAVAIACVSGCWSGVSGPGSAGAWACNAAVSRAKHGMNFRNVMRIVFPL